MKLKKIFLMFFINSTLLLHTSYVQSSSYFPSISNPFNTLHHYGARALKLGNQLISNISSPLYNSMTTWSTGKLLKVVSIGIGILITIFGIIKTHDFFLETAMIYSSKNPTPQHVVETKEIYKNYSNRYNKILTQKYEQQYWLYLINRSIKSESTKQSIKNLINDVSNNNYIITQDTLNKHTIPLIENNISYLNQNVKNLNGMDWGENGLRHNALKNILQKLSTTIKDLKQLQSQPHKTITQS